MAPCVFLCESETARERWGLPTLRELMSSSDSGKREVLPSKAGKTASQLKCIFSFSLCVCKLESQIHWVEQSGPWRDLRQGLGLGWTRTSLVVGFRHGGHMVEASEPREASQAGCPGVG